MNVRQMLFIHGAGKGSHDLDAKLAASLQEQLGAEYAVHAPAMPDAGDPSYAAWKAKLHDEIDALDGPLLLVGHSLGASVLIKYLAEETPSDTINGLFMIATPFWGAHVSEFQLADNFAQSLPHDLPVFLYYSRDDEIVPFEHMARYAEKLPGAVTREFRGRNHQFNNDLSEVARDIIELER